MGLTLKGNTHDHVQHARHVCSCTLLMTGVKRRGLMGDLFLSGGGTGGGHNSKQQSV